MWGFAEFFNLFIAAAGAGLLSYPYAVLQQGLLLCTGLTVLFGALNVFTDFILIQSAYLFREPLRGKAGGFDSLCALALGPRIARLSRASIVFGALGAQIGYLIAIGDLVCRPLQEATRCSGPAAGGGACLLTSRGAVIPALAFAITLPLTFFSSASSLLHSSFLAAATVLAVCGVVAAQGLAALGGGGGGALTPVGSATHYPSSDAPSDLVLSRWTMAVFLGIPISVFSLGNHMQVLPLYLDTPSPSPQNRHFPWIVTAAVASCVALYLTTGVLGYAAYRSSTAGDVMVNLPDTPATAVGKVLLAVHLLLSYPVLFFPSRRSLLAAAGELAQWLAARDAGAGRPPGALSRAAELCSASPFLIPSVVTAAAALLAVGAPSISVVFGLLGATVATVSVCGGGGAQPAHPPRLGGGPPPPPPPPFPPLPSPPPPPLFFLLPSPPFPRCSTKFTLSQGCCY